MTKLTWINQQHARALPFDKIQPIVAHMLTSSASPIVSKEKLANPTDHATKFLNIATKIAQRDMDLTTDTNRLVSNCLKYEIEENMSSDVHVAEVINESLHNIINTLLTDFDSGVFPKGTEENFDDLWKTYMKTLGTKLGLKGKNLFHPVRFLLTGRMSGPDVGDQVKLIGLADGMLHSDYKMSTVADRMNYLRQFSLSHAQELVKEAKAKAEAAEAEMAAATAAAKVETLIAV